MRTLITLFVSLLAVPALAQDWKLADVKKQVLRLESTPSSGIKGVCSTAVFKPGHALTAAHCVDETDVDFTVDGRHAIVLRRNRGLDLAIMKFIPKGEVPIPLALKLPKTGQEVSIVGFAFGKPDLHAQFGRVSNPKDSDGYTVLNMDTIFGDSGGPVLDRKGNLVGIVSAIQARGPAHLGLAVPIDTIRDFLEEIDKKPEPLQAARLPLDAHK